VLCQLTSVVNYGGRITDDKDMRTSDIIIADFFTPKILLNTYKFSRSGAYYSLEPGTHEGPIAGARNLVAIKGGICDCNL
jgi:hypothetical protein